MSTVRQLYKSLLRTAKLLPKEQSLSALQEIRTKFHNNINETDPEKIHELMHEAESRLKFMKMITPRQTSEKAENKVYRVNEKGELVEGHGDYANDARLSHFGMTTDEMRFINEQQLRRMSFLPYKKRI
ncbi:hypothetical protein JH06_3504 [Blastocystis sp. subtype 4]|uniref:hypothetical protein n=1 Tax=Blastocystis sp. subtype 4 TaxID=944170 RepID=UPI000711FD5A|nr:hypothetical protein JH06_3504 [Blastocystis sp. subtype 4]KNB42839.1 hypothetical protein JH06_3504 [Blastocystis sp. subtype 4]|eukprot:XP_014526282.1 hypothetical protein JH06_3504 [Blastocystis sp. subtype 4]